MHGVYCGSLKLIVRINILIKLPFIDLPFSCVLVYKNKGHRNQGKQSTEAGANPPTTFIPVVGESEPELKMTGAGNAQKRKLDPSQLATDDYFYDKYRKKTKHY